MNKITRYMKQQIFADKEGKEFLKSLYGCTDVMIWKALTFDSDSELARKIRKTIYEHQGTVGFLGKEPPRMETECNESHIITTFGLGISVNYDKEWETATLRIDGEVAGLVTTSNIEEYMVFLSEANKRAWQRYLQNFL